MLRLRIVPAFFLAVLSAAAASGQDDPKFLFGLENRFGESLERGGSDSSVRIIPNLSYHPSSRFRLDASAGLLWSDSDGFALSLQPGFRYYLRPAPGKLRLNTGLSVGFELIDNIDARREEPPLVDFGHKAGSARPDDDVWLRLVPLEVEYWAVERLALTFALDYQTRVFDSTGTTEDDFGFALGFRYKIR